MPSTIARSWPAVVGLYRRLSGSIAAKSAFWVFLGSASQQLLRLGANLILTRLMFPEIFGIMALVHAIIIGLNQLSDVGLREGVVNSDRINDPAFMRTAWTLQLLRSSVIALMAFAIAYPVGKMYDEALLTPVLIMTAVGVFISGFKSISLLAYDKRLDLKTQILMDLAVQVASLTLMIIWAWISPTIWVMVGGHLFAAILDVVLSYYLFKGHHSRLAWDTSATRQLFGFGKWIMLSTAISYITVQGDKLIMGGFLSMVELGIYSLASTWSAIVAILAASLSTRVLHPYFKQAIDTHSDHAQIYKVRNGLNVGYMVVCVVLAILGDALILFLYDDRYRDAGWMLQVLALGQVGRSLSGTLLPFMLANGDSFNQMKFSAAGACILVVLVFCGGWLLGPAGVIIGYALTGFVAHPVIVVFAAKHRYYCAKADLSIALVAIVLCSVCWWYTQAPVLAVLKSLLHMI